VTRPEFDNQAYKELKNESISEQLVTVFEPASMASEAYRNLRTSLLYAQLDTPPKVIVVTSAGAAEGKSTVCANLGVVLAQAGKNTLIVDCDLRRPAMHEIFGSDGDKGLVSVLARECDLDEACGEPLPGLPLQVLTAGPLPPNPVELLGSRRVSEFFQFVRQKFDYVLVDSPPTRPVSDAIILAAQGDGILLTLDTQKTRKGDVRRAMRSLTAVGANVLGTVTNNVKGARDAYY
jgi:capsular exopolysaccharide synthesis family protein